MKHLGDITKIKGYAVPVVDCVIGGSPCQDLSIAGKKRAGLGGERSGLFMEQIRIIKEMREHERSVGRTDESIRPRYMVWENVPGAFSSNKGEDFRIVLEETAKVADKDAVIPGPADGKWKTAGCIVADRWSIAWRVLDAQFWGVPQRRRRIALVADFGGQSAAEILFVRKGVSRDSEPSKQERKDITANVGAGTNGCGFSFQERGGRPGGGKGILIQEDRTGALSTLQNQFVVDEMKPQYPDKCGCLTAKMQEGYCGQDAHNDMFVVEPIVLESNQNNATITNNGVCPTLPASMGMGGGYVPMTTQPIYAVDMGGGKSAVDVLCGKSPTLATTNYGEPAVVYDARGNGNGSVVPTMTGNHMDRITDYTGVVVALEGNGQRPSHMGDGYSETDKMYTMNSTEVHGVAYMEAYGFYPQMKAEGQSFTEDKSPSLVIGTNPGFKNGVCYGFDAGASRDVGELFIEDASKTVSNGTCPGHHNGVVIGFDAYNQDETGDKTMSLTAGSGPNHVPCIVENKIRYVVRRLTPLEAERLQGYPDGWTQIGSYFTSKGKNKEVVDSERYKALGNSIALPQWKWVLKRLCGCYERDCTMASLFDGIGGFPYIWEQLNGKGSCLWASEIEEFPIAVTKRRICETNNEYDELNEQHKGITTLTEKRFFKWEEDDKSVTIRNCSGSYGGERSICCDTVGSICARDYKGVGNEYVQEGKIIIEHTSS